MTPLGVMSAILVFAAEKEHRSERTLESLKDEISKFSAYQQVMLPQQFILPELK